MKIFQFVLVAVLTCTYAFAGSVDNLMPKPAEISISEGKFRISDNLMFETRGAADTRLRAYIDRVKSRLERRTVISLQRADQSTASQIIVETAAANTQYPKLGDNESYILSIRKDLIRLIAPTNTGAMRGLETLLQLLDSDENGYFFQAVEIKDAPRFPWRGLMIDVGRHYEPMHVLKRNIDAMAAVKLNVLHWHLTEDQGFRAESKKLPKLHTLGSDGLFYTQAEMREIVDYAADRGIRVMPEFDMPGHATAWLVGHPEIGSAPGPYKIERLPGVFNPTMDPTNKQTYKLLEKFLGEMAKIFPDQYMHIGGDENDGKHWDANQKIQAYKQKNGLKTNHDLQTVFNKNVHKILKKNNKIMMGWDEIFQPNLPSGVVIHSWRGQKAMVEAAKKGYQSVLSNGYYIDLMESAERHYKVDPLPANTELNAEEQKRVLGGEATMWSEWVTPETIDSRIWMRTAAIAERLWSPREVNDIDDMYRRLDILSIQLEDLGLSHRKNQLMLLRRLTNRNDVGALKEFVDLIVPVKGYHRYQLLKQNMLDPFTGLIDAAQADARGARKFSKSVSDYINGDAPSAERIRSAFAEWKSLSNSLSALFETTPTLKSAQKLQTNLSVIADLGESILAKSESKTKYTAAESKQILKQLDDLKIAQAGCEFAIIDPLKSLVASISQ
ncbi:MAG: beta-N-acetylhexosaminidase [Pyrinomonadaceae bacterium]